MFNLPLLSCFIVFCVWLRYELKKSKSKSINDRNTFFENEAQANLTRKKPLNALNYITVSEKSILFIEINDDNIKKIQKNFVDLKDKKIVNLTNMTNTDLKREYGPGNLNTLIEYGDNYILLIRSLHDYARRLSELEFTKEGIEVLEFSIMNGCDMISSYKLLTELYINTNQTEKINQLIDYAKNLDSITRTPILNFLNSSIV